MRQALKEVASLVRVESVLGFECRFELQNSAATRGDVELSRTLPIVSETKFQDTCLTSMSNYFFILIIKLQDFGRTMKTKKKKRSQRGPQWHAIHQKAMVKR